MGRTSARCSPQFGPRIRRRWRAMWKGGGDTTGRIFRCWAVASGRNWGILQATPDRGGTNHPTAPWEQTKAAPGRPETVLDAREFFANQGEYRHPRSPGGFTVPLFHPFIPGKHPAKKPGVGCSEIFISGGGGAVEFRRLRGGSGPRKRGGDGRWSTYGMFRPARGARDMPTARGSGAQSEGMWERGTAAVATPHRPKALWGRPQHPYPRMFILYAAPHPLGAGRLRPIRGGGVAGGALSKGFRTPEARGRLSRHIFRLSSSTQTSSNPEALMLPGSHGTRSAGGLPPRRPPPSQRGGAWQGPGGWLREGARGRYRGRGGRKLGRKPVGGLDGPDDGRVIPAALGPFGSRETILKAPNPLRLPGLRCVGRGDFAPVRTTAVVGFRPSTWRRKMKPILPRGRAVGTAAVGRASGLTRTTAAGGPRPQTPGVLDKHQEVHGRG